MLKQLREANITRSKEWQQGVELSLSFRGNELAGEVGETCNLIKKLDRERLGIAGSRAAKGHINEELADIIICVDLIAMDLGIDLEAAVQSKFNQTSDKIGLETKIG